MKWFYQKDEIEVGIDEVARGCLFGRVYTAAVIWPYDETFAEEEYEEKEIDDKEDEEDKDEKDESEKESIEKIVTSENLHCPITKDSKQYTPQKRKELYQYILDNALEVQYSYCEAEEIDDINILQATYKSMHKTLDKFSTKVDRILVDGDRFKPYYNSGEDNEWVPYACFPKGDTLYLPISAASIVAKVEHDMYIERLCQEYPDLDERYGLLSNMGYGSQRHRDGITKYGISQFHRKTFGCCQQVDLSRVVKK